MIKNVFLDAGGVILDESQHENRRAELSVSLLKKLSSSYSLEDYWHDVEEAVRIYVPRVYEYVFWKHTSDNDLFKSLYGEYKLLWRKENPPLILMHGISYVLQHLSSTYRFGIAGQYGRQLLDTLREYGLLAHFIFPFSRDDFELTKPDPRYYEQILRKAGVRAEESVMVGDRIDKDMIPAKQVGMKTIRIRTGVHKSQVARIPSEIADGEIDSVYEMEQALEEIS
jgi:FMN phosphatase YigB (HAD superfamily)